MSEQMYEVRCESCGITNRSTFRMVQCGLCGHRLPISDLEAAERAEAAILEMFGAGSEEQTAAHSSPEPADPPRWEFAFEEFIRELQKASFFKRYPSRLESFRKKYHRELAFLCLYLSEIETLAGEPSYHASPPLACDLCSSPMSGTGFFVDGMTAEGPWANMCAKCYVRQGQGVGWGVGQLYQATRDGRWKLVGGGHSDDVR